MDLLARNPFRLANLSSLARLDEVKARLGELDLCRRAGIVVPVPLEEELGVPEDLSALRSQVGSLAVDPTLQFCYRLLWPRNGWPEEALTPELCLARLPPAGQRSRGDEHRAFLAHLVRFSRIPNHVDALRVMEAWFDLDEGDVYEAVESDLEDGDEWADAVARVEGFLVGLLLRGASRLRSNGSPEWCRQILEEMWACWEGDADVRNRILWIAVEIGDALEKAIRKATADLGPTLAGANPAALEERQLKALIRWLGGACGQTPFWEQSLAVWNEARGAAMQRHAHGLARIGDFAGAAACLGEALKLDLSADGRRILLAERQELELAARRQAERVPVAVGGPVRTHPAGSQGQAARTLTTGGTGNPGGEAGLAVALVVLALFGLVRIIGSFVFGVGAPALPATSPPAVPNSAAPSPEGFEPVALTGRLSTPSAEPTKIVAVPGAGESKRQRAWRLGAEHDAISAEIKSLKSGLDLRESEIDEQQSQLDSQSARIESVRPFVDPEDPTGMLSFNRDVDAYNELLERHRQDLRDYKAGVSRYNDRLNRLRRVESALDEMGLLTR